MKAVVRIGLVLAMCLKKNLFTHSQGRWQS